jgi:hypothetical protein
MREEHKCEMDTNDILEDFASQLTDDECTKKKLQSVML